VEVNKFLEEISQRTDEPKEAIKAGHLPVPGDGGEWAKPPVALKAHFEKLNEKFTVPKYFWPDGFSPAPKPDPVPVPQPRPKPVSGQNPVIQNPPPGSDSDVSGLNTEESMKFKGIIEEIPSRRTTPWYRKMFAIFASILKGTSYKFELARQTIGKLGKEHFKGIENKKSFLTGAFEYINESGDENPAELTKAECVEFLLCFCKEYFSSNAVRQNRTKLEEARKLANTIRDEVKKIGQKLESDSQEAKSKSRLEKILADVLQEVDKTQLEAQN
jgi:hypothetical protein